MAPLAICFILWWLAIGIPCAAGADWDVVEGILQRKGERSGSSVSFSYPRMERRPGKGKQQEIRPSSMESRIVFTTLGSRLAKLEGVIVALPRERGAVERKLRAEGLLVTKVEQCHDVKGGGSSIHFSGRGDPVTLVWAFTPALSATDTPMGPPLFPCGNRCR